MRPQFSQELRLSSDDDAPAGASAESAAEPEPETGSSKAVPLDDGVPTIVIHTSP
jgi:hypothetical protein